MNRVESFLIMADRYPIRDRRPNPRYAETSTAGAGLSEVDKLREEIQEVERNISQRKCATTVLWVVPGSIGGSVLSPHENKVRGKSVQVEHICAACRVRSSKRSSKRSTRGFPIITDLLKTMA